MSASPYKNAFFVAAALCIVLAAVVALLLVHRIPANSAPTPYNPVIAEGPAAGSSSQSGAAQAADGQQPTLGAVYLSPRRRQEIGLTTALVQQENISEHLQAPGNVDIDEERLSYVQTRFPGWIKSVFANATWQYVRKGQPLFTVYSPDLVSTEQEYLLARQNQKSLATGGPGTAAQEGKWLLDAAKERLRQFDIPPAEIASLVKSGKVQREITMDSPASGYITQRNALPNAYVRPDTKLYTIADLSTVWVYANVFQSDVGELRPGDPAQVTVDAYPGRVFYGRIDQILPDVDPVTRTVRVRLVFRNPGIILKPGMYVNVDMTIPLGRQLVVPASGVLRTGTQNVAFVDQGGGNLQPRIVQLGRQVNQSWIVLKGLKAGERIVSSANFLLDSEAQLQSAMQSASPSPQNAAPSAQIAFSTNPSPPQKGSNALQVKLTDADGKPVSGAQVTVTFFMPAMPAMGMAAMHASATLQQKGQGIYEGSAVLHSGGTWQGVVSAIRGGKPLASKQLSVTVAGGME
jgi:Cu(I)/Ag(I) efflux system membrane fusion protein/cobalt-zinc-cadmium efflux system membrane fusion protein